VLVCSPRVLEAKWHGYVVVGPKRGDKRGRKLVGLFHHDLVITRVSIKEAEGFATRGGINYLIDAR
jgi:hypothetical protein